MGVCGMPLVALPAAVPPLGNTKPSPVELATFAVAGEASGVKLTPCGELKLNPGALSADSKGVKAPVCGSTWPNAFRLPTEA